jgi:hypothetical protein
MSNAITAGRPNMNAKQNSLKTADPAKMDEYDMNRHLQTLTDAHHIKGNKKLHTAVLAHGKKKMDAMKAVMDPMEPDADDK